MSDITFLDLPTWAGGSLKIRYIYLVNNTSFSLTECPNKDKGHVIPLYLGADLLSNTDIRTENHPRFHAKFAKKGLATKLHFPSIYRFQGLRLPVSNNSLWFYSVQGVFRVAFELYKRHDQLSILEHFQDTWKSHFDDDPLQTGYSISEQQDLAAVIQQAQNNISKPHPTPKDPLDTSEDHDYCSHHRESNVSASLHQKIQQLNDLLPQIQPEQHNTLETFLGFLYSYVQGDLQETTATEAVTALLQSRPWDGVYSSSLLNAVGRWLGRQFHEANASISQKVEGFKVQHIEHISDLPPAEELSRELFPEAMLGLLLHWMGLSEDSSVDKRHSEYPILLLILEFANHNLITGVAHVLYSSLICK